MSAVFVTGTGTGVGKTFVTAAFVRLMRERGRRVDALKPVASGFDPAHLATSDTGILLAALGDAPTSRSVEHVSPWRFAAPLSPDMAARREGRSIDYASLLAYTRRAIGETPDLLLIEGIGGLMVPLDATHTVLDWIESIKVPVLLVGGSYLGGISHALISLEILATRAVRVIAMIVDESEDSIDLGETVATIERFAGGTRIIGVPRVTSGGDLPDALHRVADLL